MRENRQQKKGQGADLRAAQPLPPLLVGGCELSALPRAGLGSGMRGAVPTAGATQSLGQLADQGKSPAWSPTARADVALLGSSCIHTTSSGSSEAWGASVVHHSQALHTTAGPGPQAQGPGPSWQTLGAPVEHRRSCPPGSGAFLLGHEGVPVAAGPAPLVGPRSSSDAQQRMTGDAAHFLGLQAQETQLLAAGGGGPGSMPLCHVPSLDSTTRAEILPAEGRRPRLAGGAPVAGDVLPAQRHEGRSCSWGEDRRELAEGGGGMSPPPPTLAGVRQPKVYPAGSHMGPQQRHGGHRLSRVTSVPQEEMDCLMTMEVGGGGRASFHPLQTQRSEHLGQHVDAELPFQNSGGRGPVPGVEPRDVLRRSGNSLAAAGYTEGAGHDGAGNRALSRQQLPVDIAEALETVAIGQRAPMEQHSINTRRTRLGRHQSMDFIGSDCRPTAVAGPDGTLLIDCSSGESSAGAPGSGWDTSLDCFTGSLSGSLGVPGNRALVRGRSQGSPHSRPLVSVAGSPYPAQEHSTPQPISQHQRQHKPLGLEGQVLVGGVPGPWRHTHPADASPSGRETLLRVALHAGKLSPTTSGVSVPLSPGSAGPSTPGSSPGMNGNGAAWGQHSRQHSTASEPGQGLGQYFGEAGLHQASPGGLPMSPLTAAPAPARLRAQMSLPPGLAGGVQVLEEEEARQWIEQPPEFCHGPTSSWKILPVSEASPPQGPSPPMPSRPTLPGLSRRPMRALGSLGSGKERKGLPPLSPMGPGNGNSSGHSPSLNPGHTAAYPEGCQRVLRDAHGSGQEHSRRASARREVRRLNPIYKTASDVSHLLTDVVDVGEAWGVPGGEDGADRRTQTPESSQLSRRGSKTSQLFGELQRMEEELRNRKQRHQRTSSQPPREVSMDMGATSFEEVGRTDIRWREEGDMNAEFVAGSHGSSRLEPWQPEDVGAQHSRQLPRAEALSQGTRQLNPYGAVDIPPVHRKKKASGGPKKAQEETDSHWEMPKGRVLHLDQECRRLTDSFSLGKVIGEGQFGVIRVVEHRSNGRKFACKSIAKSAFQCQEDVDDVVQEHELFGILEGHPDVCHLKDVFEDDEEIHFVMELCTGGDVFDRLKTKKRYTEPKAAAVLRTLLSVLRYCHERRIVHRDIKPENMLLCSKSSDTDIKVIDFGIAAIMKLDREPLTELMGSLMYTAPEVIDGCYGCPADVWSAGVVLYILLLGVPPFWAKTEGALIRAVKGGQLKFKASVPLSEAAKDLICRMLDRDPARRLTAAEALGHQWLKAHL